MALLDMLSKQFSPEVVRNLGGHIGASEEQTTQAISALLPMMLGGLSKNTRSSQQGMNALSAALERDHDGSILEHVSTMLGENQAQANPLSSLMGGLGGAAANQMLSGLLGGRSGGRGGSATDLIGGLLSGSKNGGGDMLSSLLGGGGSTLLGMLLGTAPNSSRASNVAGILGHILGDQTSSVQRGVSKAVGLDSAKVGTLMALLAPMILGALGRSKRQQNLGAKDLSDLIDNERRSIEQRVPGMQPGGLMNVLSQNNNNDQLIKMGGQLAKTVLFGNR